MNIIPLSTLREKSSNIPYVKEKLAAKPDQERQFFPDRPIWRWLLLGFLFFCALAVRIYGIDEYPLDFQPVKQYRSALAARAYYYQSIDSIPEWKRQVALANLKELGKLGPPIMERISALLYHLTGGEHLWIPRLLSAFSWLVGGVFLYLIARKVASPDAAIVSIAYYLFNPFGIIASQSFQPDPAMVMMMIISLYTIIRYYESTSLTRLMLSALVSSIAILIKPVSAFFIFGAFIPLTIYKLGLRRTILNTATWIFIIISILPSALYYGYGIFVSGALRGQAQDSFIPSLLLYPYFWQFWFKHIYRVIGFAALVGALLGVLLVPAGRYRVFILGLWMSYVVYGVVFTYHIHTHDYYQLPFIPIVALSLGPLVAMILSHFVQLNARWPRRVIVSGILLLAIFLNIGLYLRERQELPDFGREVQLAAEIGAAVAHSPSTLFLAHHYGRVLQYHGEISGEPWPIRADFRSEKLIGKPELSVEERFDLLSAEYHPEYFIVTEFQEFEAQADLKEYLTVRFPILNETKDYIIFDLRREIDA
jgi:4-amino-4-deoxy-L-arabinose transferase-like glycosyltransferase